MAFKVVETGTSRIAVIRIVHPPMNALTRTVRQMIASALDQIGRDPDLDGVVLCGTGKIFATGIPLSEIDDGIMPPRLSDICERIEQMTKPVLALIEGHVAAAGLELALASHIRAATETARLGLPDFRMGLPPMGGATQRLPRLVGADAALTMLLGCKPHPAFSPVCAKAIDHKVTPDRALAEAVEIVAARAASGDWTRTRDRVAGGDDPLGYQKEVDGWRRRMGQRPGSLASRIIETVEAAQLLPFEAGLAQEATCFEDLSGTAESRGLRRVRQNEQMVNRLTTAGGAAVRRIAVLGAQKSSIRFGGAALFGGLEVMVYGPDAEVADEMCEELWQKSRPGLESRGLAEKAEASLRSSGRPEDFETIQLVFVSPYGDDGQLADTLARIAPHMAKNAVVLIRSDGNIAHLIPEGLEGRVFALAIADRDFPARAAEVNLPDTVPADVLNTVQSALWGLNRVIVRSTRGRGMLITAMFDVMMSAADALVRGGISPRRIELAMQAYGFPRSPYAVLMQGDSAGYLSRTLNRRGQAGLSHRVLTEGIVPIVDNETSSLLEFVATEVFEVGPLELSDEEIAGAITAAMTNAGCRLIAEGAAFRPMQVDTLMVHGFGYPRDRAGPMADADLTGLRVVLERCQSLAIIDPDIWSPHPMLKDFYVSGLSFQDLDQRQEGAQAA